MSEPRHISECIAEWLTEYAAINGTTARTAAHSPEPERQPRDPAEAKHANTHEEHV